MGTVSGPREFPWRLRKPIENGIDVKKKLFRLCPEKLFLERKEKI